VRYFGPPGSGSTDPIESGSNPDPDTDPGPDPQPCLCQRLKRRHKSLIPEHHQQVEEDAGGADYLQALDIPQQGQGQSNKQTKT
jgi:hypothetical protein